MLNKLSSWSDLNNYANIFQKLTKFEFQTDLALLNKIYLFFKGDLLRTRMPKLRSKTLCIFKNIIIFLFFVFYPKTT